MPHLSRDLIPYHGTGATVDLARVHARAEAKVAEIQEKMENLQRMRDTHLKLIGTGEGSGSLDDCPILDAIDEGSS